jgi:hypothetical protein
MYLWCFQLSFFLLNFFNYLFGLFYFILFIYLFLPSWAFRKPQSSFACIRKVHVGIVNSVVHHPNTQSTSILVKCSVGHVNVSRVCPWVYIYSSTNTYRHFFSKIEELLDPIREPSHRVPLHNKSHIFQDCMMYIKYEYLHRIKLKLGIHTRYKVLQQINKLIQFTYIKI